MKTCARAEAGGRRQGRTELVGGEQKAIRYICEQSLLGTQLLYFLEDLLAASIISSL